MIRVTIYKTDRHEYAGFDISINSIDRFTDDRTSSVSDEESGMIEFRFKEIPSHDASLLLDSMVLGLEQIEDSNEYEPYIDIIFKEV